MTLTFHHRPSAPFFFPFSHLHLQDAADEEGFFRFSTQVFSKPQPGTRVLFSYVFWYLSVFPVWSRTDFSSAAVSLQVNPDRWRLRRGETVAVSSPTGSLKERRLARSHTLDTGAHTPERTHALTVADPTDVACAPELPDGAESLSTDASSCSTGSETSPSTPSTTSSQVDSSADVPLANILSAHSDPESQTDRDLHADSSDGRPRPGEEAEGLPSEHRDEDSTPYPLNLPSPTQSERVEESNANQQPEPSAQ